MNAEMALMLSNRKKVVEPYKDYKKIQQQIKEAADKGKTYLLFLYWELPPTDTFNKLKDDGYYWYRYGGGFFDPIVFYKLSWELPKPTFWQKIKNIFKKQTQ